MPRYMIELTHGEEHTACVRALRAVQEYGSHLVTRADWGCRDGIHTGWLIAELDTRDEAMGMVPPEFRKEARIVELTRFTPEGIGALVDELERGAEEPLREIDPLP